MNKLKKLLISCGYAAFVCMLSYGSIPYLKEILVNDADNTPVKILEYGNYSKKYMTEDNVKLTYDKRSGIVTYKDTDIKYSVKNHNAVKDHVLQLLQSFKKTNIIFSSSSNTNSNDIITNKTNTCKIEDAYPKHLWVNAKKQLKNKNKLNSNKTLFLSASDFNQISGNINVYTALLDFKYGTTNSLLAIYQPACTRAVIDLRLNGTGTPRTVNGAPEYSAKQWFSKQNVKNNNLNVSFLLSLDFMKLPLDYSDYANYDPATEAAICYANGIKPISQCSRQEVIAALQSTLHLTNVTALAILLDFARKNGYTVPTADTIKIAPSLINPTWIYQGNNNVTKSIPGYEIYGHSKGTTQYHPVKLQTSFNSGLDFYISYTEYPLLYQRDIEYSFKYNTLYSVIKSSYLFTDAVVYRPRFDYELGYGTQPLLFDAVKLISEDSTFINNKNNLTLSDIVFDDLIGAIRVGDTEKGYPRLVYCDGFPCHVNDKIFTDPTVSNKNVKIIHTVAMLMSGLHPLSDDIIWPHKFLMFLQNNVTNLIFSKPSEYSEKWLTNCRLGYDAIGKFNIPDNAVFPYYYNLSTLADQSGVNDSYGLSTFIHENCHAIFGLPDYYAYGGTEVPYGCGPGKYTPMSGNLRPMQNLDPYTRECLNWQTPILLPKYDNLKHKIRIPWDKKLSYAFKFGDISQEESEFYYIENRLKLDNDKNLPASGIFIWRSDPNGNNRDPQYKTYPSISGLSSVKRITAELSLELADGLYELEQKRYEDYCDAWFSGNPKYKSNGVFGANTIPTSRWIDGSDSGLELSDFSENGEYMTFSYKYTKAIAQDEKETEIAFLVLDINTPSVNYQYTGTSIKPTVTIKWGNTTIDNSKFNITYDTDTVSAGLHLIKVTAKEDYFDCGSFSIYDKTKLPIIIPYNIILSKSITTATVSLSSTSFTYNGSILKPTVTSVVLDGNTLVSGTDYTVSYSDSNSKNANSYSVTVTGKGNYSGTKTVSYTINAKSITPTITLSLSTFTYNGNSQKPTVTIKDGTTTLVENTDYIITWPNDTENVGTKTITITCKGNYTGSNTANYYIVDVSSLYYVHVLCTTSRRPLAILNPPLDISIKDDNGNIISSDLTQIKSGGLIYYRYKILRNKPQNYILPDGYTLVRPYVSDIIHDVDESVLNTNAYLYANIMIWDDDPTQITEDRITKNNAVVFLLVQRNESKSITTATVTLSLSTFTYNGNSQKPTVTVKDGTTVLVENTDYTIIWPNDTISVGTKTITVTGKGNYTGSKTASYEILNNTSEIPLCLTAVENNSSVSLKTDQTCIQYSNDNINYLQYTSELIIPLNTNDKVFFKTTKNISKIGLFSMTGKIKASGDIMTLASINRTPGYCAFSHLFDGCSSLVLAPDIPEILSVECCVAMFAFCTSLTTIPNLPAKILPDYCYQMMFYGCTGLTLNTLNLPVTTIGLGSTDIMFYMCTNPTIIYMLDLSINDFDYKNNGLSGNVLKIIFKDGEWTKQKYISSATVALSSTSFTYNGSILKPTVTSVVLDGNTLVSGTDYTVSIPDSKYVEAYNVTITGIGNYTGTKTISYLILPKPVTSTSTIVQDYTTVDYNGSSQISSVVSVDGIPVASSDYDKTNMSSDTTNPGQKSYTAQFKNNFSGSCLVNWTIVGVNQYIYTGYLICPSVICSYRGTRLVEGTDYTVEYGTNVGPGTNTGVVKVHGIGRFYGTKIIYFDIIENTDSYSNEYIMKLNTRPLMMSFGK